MMSLVGRKRVKSGSKLGRTLTPEERSQCADFLRRSRHQTIEHNRTTVYRGRWDYDDSMIPSWCRMSPNEHHDGIGGCFGISHWLVKKNELNHCKGCEFCDTSFDRLKAGGDRLMGNKAFVEWWIEYAAEAEADVTLDTARQIWTAGRNAEIDAASEKFAAPGIRRELDKLKAEATD